ncbi:hypothetical protein CEQ90_09615 [Lewinellaceae bacterium SD302]|nr:hypothetical protein CEQ90_09615 [Lewinellaceae bacterium SD302]
MINYPPPQALGLKLLVFFTVLLLPQVNLVTQVNSSPVPSLSTKLAYPLKTNDGVVAYAPLLTDSFKAKLTTTLRDKVAGGIYVVHIWQQINGYDSLFSTEKIVIQ